MLRVDRGGDFLDVVVPINPSISHQTRKSYSEKYLNIDSQKELSARLGLGCAYPNTSISLRCKNSAIMQISLKSADSG